MAQAHVPVVGVAGAVAVVAEVAEFGELRHRLVGLVVVERVGVRPTWTGMMEGEIRGGWIEFGLLHSLPSCYNPHMTGHPQYPTAQTKSESVCRGAA